MNYKDNIEEVKNDCYDFETFKQIEIEQSYYAKDSGIYTMSLMIDNILYWMKNRIKINNLEEVPGQPKIVMYCGHDTTLIGIQRFLKDSLNINFVYTPFAFTQFFELKKINNEFFVQIYYDENLVYNEKFQEFEQKVNKILVPQLYVINYCEGMSYDMKISIILICIFLFLLIVYSSLVYLFFQKLKSFNNTNASDVITNTI